MNPAFGTVARKCTKDYKIPDSNIVIETGTSIIIPVAAIHRDPKYYDQASEFIPERFDEENKTSIDDMFMPFGRGPRLVMLNQHSFDYPNG